VGSSQAKPNIWDTVATLHEERAQHIAETVTKVIDPEKRDHVSVPARAAGTAPAQAPAPESVHGTVIKPGEVHTF
jgi:cytochrome c556